ncbi:MAG: UDP-N-acetylmuramoyl-tripeptide--D-alanyl-D-alanine ligase [Xanthomonadales bacterium]|nr:UDP-N-acetylmuramoyl-tripeptide--D-alanyl-D-alanine ligase [Xanthomonadales bacterium]NIN59745.1 UDP-N-acetylmuramoyl-tripeptide--D-alanyl-D-alanine ligase [Xanthomonadales bacterium]NIN75514.1 UDP-N-acetylmuramoyl-tripeptide--D-alanyl-D-alanine ligase [Xanthomonadales bacterium]NIO15203.1 UDP-N-acetylmuramoyl-tripeptide--D-alanyl-D-alanine ligase [Xanthomonadales bacterium]NIP12138.1 UDP-N-acetylmuramoyl-tripeptide--D-alanyl-D-alanine ligase [Xanthomonadales bacterium]
MITLTFAELGAVLGCQPDDGSTRFCGVSTDSRTVAPGMLFAALPGERVDGHEFIGQAVEAGAVAVLAQRAGPPIGVPQLVVDDVLAALGRLARAWRDRHQPQVVAITGSNGKTTTKEMVASILGLSGEVLATAGNYNNELGLPLTLFGLGAEHRYAVLEMGAAKAGDIAYLAGIAAPRVGLITNVGPAHLQGFGDEAGVARAKGELYTALPPDGVAVVNADEPWRDMWLDSVSAGSTLLFGGGPHCDVWAEPSSQGHRIHSPAGTFEVRLHLPGRHNLQNALAATAVACALEVPREQIRAGLERTRPVPGRLNLDYARGGWTVIDDTYNANPASLYAALQVLAEVRGESWLVLGDMKELGPESRKMHAEMGDAAQALGVKRLFAIGEVTPATVDAFGEGGRHFSDHQALIEVLCAELRPEVTCLVKGSRSMGMERVVHAISGDCAGREVAEC